MVKKHMKAFEELESEVRTYIRSFPAVFERARGHELVDENGKSYIDFLAGAGALNYGHNDPRLKRSLREYFDGDGIIHSLDMATTAKRKLLERLDEVILKPRGLDYRVQFPGPTGTNAVEAALKLTRKVTGRTKVYGFEGGFHGMTLGSLSITSNSSKRDGAGVLLTDTALLPYFGQTRDGMDSLRYLEWRLTRDAQRNDLPASIILETVQCEGGVNVASFDWLERVAQLAASHGVLLIVDDIQAGCGRTGPFFSFDDAGLEPDVVCLSKSLSGLGLPLALVLFKRELDVWEPGEHNGTFRGHNPAFVTATEALGYWEDDALRDAIERKASLVEERLEGIAAEYPEAEIEVRGRGLIQGLAMGVVDLACEVSRCCFERGLVIETAGHHDEVLKFLPPLTIEDGALVEGLDIVEASLQVALAARDTRARDTSIAVSA
jgi:diaminobutyrate-2-oxoglutarate transaminase